MPSQRRRKPLHAYFPPDLAESVRHRIARLEVRRSDYFAILLRNAIYSGRPKIVTLSEPELSDRVREDFPFSLTPRLQADATEFARDRGGTVSRLLEELASRDVAAPEAGLVIWPRGR